MAEEKQNPESLASQKAGTLLREARIAAGVDAAQLCATLRISTAALENLETSQYDRLPGDPYVRALIGSVSRSLGADLQPIMRAYIREMGAAPAESSVSPYQDVSEVHGLAHRKWFFALLAALLIALLFILGRINSSPEKNAAATQPDRNETIAVLIPPPSDTLPESDALRPDSLMPDTAKKTAAKSKKDTVRAIPKTAVAKAAAVKPVVKDAANDTVKEAKGKEVKDTAQKAASKTGEPKTEEIVTRITIKSLQDSVQFRVLRNNKKAVMRTLPLGKEMEFTHNDTITVVLYSKRGVEISFGDKTLAPKERRFKVYGKNIIYF